MVWQADRVKAWVAERFLARVKTRYNALTEKPEMVIHPLPRLGR